MKQTPTPCEGMRPIAFTQYLRPRGEKKEITIHRPELIAAKAKELVTAGWALEAEVLMTGEVSLTCELCDDAGDLIADFIEVVPNGPEVPIAVDRMITEAHASLTKDGAPCNPT
jgi:hypothetical protein